MVGSILCTINMNNSDKMHISFYHECDYTWWLSEYRSGTRTIFYWFFTDRKMISVFSNSNFFCCIRILQSSKIKNIVIKFEKMSLKSWNLHYHLFFERQTLKNEQKIFLVPDIFKWSIIFLFSPSNKLYKSL